MLCRAGSCGRAATLHVCVDKRPVASACSRTCAEQICAQMIGMPKRAADDDDVDNNRGEFDRVREDRQRQKQRFVDFAAFCEIAAILSKIRADVYTLTLLEVSTATMRIGDRFDDDGTTMAARLDAILRFITNMQATLLAGGDYDVDQVRAQVRAFRDAIAEDTTRAKFEQAMSIIDASGSYRRLPDDIQRLMAYRANPIQKIAEFPVEYDASRIWAHNGRIRAGRGEYAYDGTQIDDSPYQYAPGAQGGFATNSSGQTIVAMEPHGSWAIVPGRSGPLLFGAQNGLFLVEAIDKIAHSSAPAKLYSFVMQPAAADVSVFYIFSAGKSIIGGVAPNRYNDAERIVRMLKMTIDNEAGVIFVDIALQRSGSFRPNTMALDSLGNFWVNDQEGIHVRDPSARNVLAILRDVIPVSICAAEDGVWIAHYTSGQMYCANYRLAPSAVYNRGLGDAQSY